MADIIMSDDVHFIMEESTEGTVAAPSSASTGYVQVIEPGIEIGLNYEMVERAIITSTLNEAKMRNGKNYPTANFALEAKGSGTEGTAPRFGVLFDSLLGTSTAITSNVTSKASGNTGTTLAIEDADISKFAVGDIVIVKQSGEHRHHAITAVATGTGAASITVTPGRAAGNFSNSVVISKSKTYKCADSGHKSFSVGRYYGGKIYRYGAGMRVKSMALTDFTVGNTCKLTFTCEGLNSSESAADPGYTPSYETTLPPIVLSAKVFIDGVETCLEKVALTIEQGIGFLPCTGSTTGRVRGRASGKRKVTGQVEPYMTDTTLAWYTALASQTDHTMLISLAEPSGTSGEFTMGNNLAIWIPSFRVADNPIDQLDGVHREVINFRAHGGNQGENSVISVGFC